MPEGLPKATPVDLRKRYAKNETDQNAEPVNLDTVDLTQITEQSSTEYPNHRGERPGIKKIYEQAIPLDSNGYQLMLHARVIETLGEPASNSTDTTEGQRPLLRVSLELKLSFTGDNENLMVGTVNLENEERIFKALKEANHISGEGPLLTVNINKTQKGGTEYQALRGQFDVLYQKILDYVQALANKYQVTFDHIARRSPDAPDPITGVQIAYEKWGKKFGSLLNNNHYTPSEPKTNPQNPSDIGIVEWTKHFAPTQAAITASPEQTGESVA